MIEMTLGTDVYCPSCGDEITVVKGLLGGLLLGNSICEKVEMGGVTIHCQCSHSWYRPRIASFRKKGLWSVVQCLFLKHTLTGSCPLRRNCRVCERCGEHTREAHNSGLYVS